MSMLAEHLGALLRQDAREDGQGLAEYALILALIAIVAVVAVLFLGGALSAQLMSIGVAVDSVSP